MALKLPNFVSSPEEITRRQLQLLIESTHTSLKWIWLVIMGSALYIVIQQPSNAAAKLFEECLYPDPLPELWECACSHADKSLTLVLLIFCFLPIFFRFYYGNVRYLDEKYREAVCVLETKEELDGGEFHNLLGGQRAPDILLLAATGSLILAMAYTIHRHMTFALTVWLLLVVDVIWVGYQIWRHSQDEPNDAAKKAGTKNPESALIFWLINNALFAGLILIAYSSWGRNLDTDGSTFWPLFVLMVFANSLLDLYFTWRFYFPNLKGTEITGTR